MSVKLRLVQLEHLARRAGFETYRDMLYTWYVLDELSLIEIAARCSVEQGRTRKHLKRFGIPLRGRGGRHKGSAKFELTQELVDEITRDGINSVAERLGMTDSILRTQLKALSSKKDKENKP